MKYIKTIKLFHSPSWDRINRCSFIIFFLAASLTGYSQKIKQVDLLIKGATVFDGTGGDSSFLNIGILEDKIVFIGRPKQKVPFAKRTIDASGLYLAPGFIDPHTHAEADLSSPSRKANLPYLMQGVTTVFTGNDGTSPLPTAQKLKYWEQNGIGTNAALFVGHGSVRRLIIGDKNSRPDQQQLDQMKEMVATSMKEGAFGLSTGLFYAPGSFADQNEIVALAKVVASFGGIYDTHVRDESSYNIGLINSIHESINISREAKIAVHISHIKALGADVWGKSAEVIKIIEQARAEGLAVTANQYPYHASRTSLVAALIPRWAEDTGTAGLQTMLKNSTRGDSLHIDIENNIRRRGGPATLVFSSSANDSINGRSLHDISLAWDVKPAEAVISILKTDMEVRVVSFNMKQTDLENFTVQPWVMTGSDGTPGHPRKYGTFVRRIKEFVIDKKLITMTFAIHASSGLTATTLNLKNRGFIKEGFFADIILFDPLALRDNATFEKPDALAGGMVYVIVNGQVVIENGQFNGKLAGKALRFLD